MRHIVFKIFAIYGNAAYDFSIRLRGPNFVLGFNKASHKLGQITGDFGFEGGAKSNKLAVAGCMHLDNAPDQTRLITCGYRRLTVSLRSFASVPACAKCRRIGFKSRENVPLRVLIDERERSGDLLFRKACDRRQRFVSFPAG